MAVAQLYLSGFRPNAPLRVGANDDLLQDGSDSTYLWFRDDTGKYLWCETDLLTVDPATVTEVRWRMRAEGSGTFQLGLYAGPESSASRYGSAAIEMDGLTASGVVMPTYTLELLATQFATRNRGRWLELYSWESGSSAKVFELWIEVEYVAAGAPPGYEPEPWTEAGEQSSARQVFRPV